MLSVYDKTGIAELAQALGWTALRVREIAGYDLPELSLEMTVDQKEDCRLADLLADAKPVAICAGFGMQRYTNSGQTMRAIIALLAITGNVGRPGAGWVYANLQSHIFSPLKDPLALYPEEHSVDPVRPSISTATVSSCMTCSARWISVLVKPVHHWASAALAGPKPAR